MWFWVCSCEGVVCRFRLGAFAIGFLGTAFPRMVGAPSLRIWELASFFAIFVAAVICQATNQRLLGDTLFLILMVAFFAALCWRWIISRDEKPPFEFVVALGGIVCAIAGFALQVAATYEFPGMMRYRFSELLIYQGLTAVPILAIGGFFAARMLNQNGGKPTRANSYATTIAVVLFVVTLAIESWGNARIADIS